MRYLLVLAFLVSVTACGPSKHRHEMLVEQADGFHRNLRWKRIQEASNFVVPWKQEEFQLTYRDRIEHISIDEIELERVEFPGPNDPDYAKDATRATLHVVRFQVESPDITRRKIKQKQSWWYLGQAWYIESGY